MKLCIRGPANISEGIPSSHVFEDFAVGQRVKVVHIDQSSTKDAKYSLSLRGFCGTVIGVKGPNSPYPVTVKIDNSGSTGIFQINELEIIDG